MADFLNKVKLGFNKGVAAVGEGSKNLMEKAKINSVIGTAEGEKKSFLLF